MICAIAALADVEAGLDFRRLLADPSLGYSLPTLPESDNGLSGLFRVSLAVKAMMLIRAKIEAFFLVAARSWYGQGTPAET
jgi:hypothetical protein